MSDTVGFIRELPETLVQAFLSTLEELCSADLILHVLDVSNRNLYENKHSVEKVLKQINAHNVPVINVATRLISSEINQKYSPLKMKCRFLLKMVLD